MEHMTTHKQTQPNGGFASMSGGLEWLQGPAGPFWACVCFLRDHAEYLSAMQATLTTDPNTAAHMWEPIILLQFCARTPS